MQTFHRRTLCDAVEMKKFMTETQSQDCDSRVEKPD